MYGLKEKNLAKTYIKLIPLGMRDPDAIRLLNWKKPTERDVRCPDGLPIQQGLTMSRILPRKLREISPRFCMRSSANALLSLKGHFLSMV